MDYRPLVEDTVLGFVFFGLGVYTVFRLLTFIHLKGKGNYVIKAFHILIFTTSALRCLWLWRAPNAYVFLLNSVSAETPGEWLSQTLNTLGTLSLFGSFLVLCCYWSYMLEHVTLKTNAEMDCYVPTHMLPMEARQAGGGMRCNCTVIEIYLMAMKALSAVGVANLAALFGGVVSFQRMLEYQAALECLAAVACIATLTILSRRIRVLLQTFGVGTQPSIEEHINRILAVTIGVNSFLVFRVLLVFFFLFVTTSGQEWALMLCTEKLSWDVFVGVKYGSEAAVLSVELIVSRILQKKKNKAVRDEADPDADAEAFGAGAEGEGGRDRARGGSAVVAGSRLNDDDADDDDVEMVGGSSTTSTPSDYGAGGGRREHGYSSLTSTPSKAVFDTSTPTPTPTPRGKSSSATATTTATTTETTPLISPAPRLSALAALSALGRNLSPTKLSSKKASSSSSSSSSSSGRR